MRTEPAIVRHNPAIVKWLTTDINLRAIGRPSVLCPPILAYQCLPAKSFWKSFAATTVTHAWAVNVQVPTRTVHHAGDNAFVQPPLYTAVFATLGDFSTDEGIEV